MADEHPPWIIIKLLNSFFLIKTFFFFFAAFRAAVIPRWLIVLTFCLSLRSDPDPRLAPSAQHEEQAGE